MTSSTATVCTVRILVGMLGAWTQVGRELPEAQQHAETKPVCFPNTVLKGLKWVLLIPDIRLEYTRRVPLLATLETLALLPQHDHQVRLDDVRVNRPVEHQHA